MASLTVRVVPRSGRTEVVRRSSGEIVVRVRAAPDQGRATSEAGAALAAFIGIPRTAVSLRTGSRSRSKVFSLEGVSDDDLRKALNGL